MRTLLLSLALVLSACFNRFTVQENVDKSFIVAAAPRVVIESFNGEITATTRAAGAVDVKVIKQGMGWDEDEAEENLSELKVTLDQVGNTVRVTIVQENCVGLCGDSGANVEISVPADARLEVRTSNGNVKSTGVAGPLVLHTSNGDIEAKGAVGRVDASSSNGDIVVEASNATLDLDTSNGSVTFTGTLVAGGSSVRSSNGRILVTLPANLVFGIDASTSNGSVTCDFSENRSDSGSNTLIGTVGSATPSVSLILETSNGDIEIRRQLT